MFDFIKKIKDGLNKFASKRVFFVAFLAFAFFAVPNISEALSLNPITILSESLGGLALGISWLIGLIGSTIVGILIWVLQIVVLASDGIVNSPAVQIGFPIILSIANLGFVITIIVIAIATIIRNQTYNIKKLLVNVIIMAVMVNFGLVISGAILGVSSRITNYFLSSMTGGTMKLASTISGIVQPQKAITSLSPDKKVPATEDGAATATTTSPADQIPVKGTTLGSFVLPITGVWLSLIMVVFLIVAFFSLIASFVIRYLKLIFLLILLPAAWMGSVLPGKTSGWSSTWWKKFNELAFYPPIVLFFLWLALRIGESAANSETFKIPVEGDTFLGPMLGGVLQELLNQIVLVGIILGGDYAAKYASSEASQKATNTALKMQGWATGKVKRAGTRAGTRIGTRGIELSRKGAEKIGDKVGGTSVGRFASRITSVPVLGGAIRATGNAIDRYSMRAKEQMGATASKSYKDEVSKMGEEELKVRSKAATGLELAAILDRASKDPKLMASVLKNIPSANKESLKKDEDLYKRYGYGKAHEAAMLESGMVVSAKHKALEDARAENKKVTDDPSSTDEQRTKANEEFVAAEKGFTEAIKKISADGANNLLFAKDKDGAFTLPDAQRKDIMQSLTGNKGWNPGRFNEFLQKAADAGNDSDISKLFEGMAAEKTNPAIIKALENGAMKNLGIDGDLVLGKELFAKAKEIHGVGEKKEKKGGPTTAVFE